MRDSFNIPLGWIHSFILFCCFTLLYRVSLFAVRPFFHSPRSAAPASNFSDFSLSLLLKRGAFHPPSPNPHSFGPFSCSFATAAALAFDFIAFLNVVGIVSSRFIQPPRPSNKLTIPSSYVFHSISLHFVLFYTLEKAFWKQFSFWDRSEQ